MGLRALNTFNSEGWFGLNCVTTLRWSPPESCVLDGIQSSSGCTMGKKNISVKEGKGVSAMFQSGSKRLQITLRPEVYKEIKQAMSPEAEQTKPDHENKSLVKHLIDAKDEELFIITIQQ
jgi:formylmethanofuran dehydrogenase subunit E